MKKLLSLLGVMCALSFPAFGETDNKIREMANETYNNVGEPSCVGMGSVNKVREMSFWEMFTDLIKSSFGVKSYNDLQVQHALHQVEPLSACPHSSHPGRAASSFEYDAEVEDPGVKTSDKHQ